jgi:hypothetical protein
MKRLNFLAAGLVFALLMPVNKAFSQDSPQVKSTVQKSVKPFNRGTSNADYFVLKSDNQEFHLAGRKGADLTAVAMDLKTPNGLGLLLYDGLNFETAVCYNYYEGSTPLNEWLAMETLPDSPSEIYFVVYNGGKSVGLVKHGEYVKTSNLKMKPTGPDEVIIQVNGVDAYVMKHIQSIKADRFYPVDRIGK